MIAQESPVPGGTDTGRKTQPYDNAILSPHRQLSTGSYPGSPSILERAARYLSAMPPAISGSRGHDATFAAAHAVVNGFALDEAAAAAILRLCFNPRCVPPWTEAELHHKVRDALATLGDRPRGYLLGSERGNLPPPWIAPPLAAPPRLRWPAPDPARITAIVKDGPGAMGLWNRSPFPLDAEDEAFYAALILKALFADSNHPDPLLCIGKSSREFATRPLSFWLASGRLADFSFIVPARMTARHGRTKAGKLSEHTLENTGPRLYAVVEFDFSAVNKATGEATMYAPLIEGWLNARLNGWTEADVTRDACAALLWHLGVHAPLALAVHSGGKSLHAWFPVGNATSADVERFMRYAASLGADPALFRNRSQFVRLPGGTREGGCRQSVFYWNPVALVNLERRSR